ncbi:hypothetical protein [Methylobacterium sp. Leaf108]|uniref:hypothetical protein n=1 Tax=Methylobacterium sp. Leaf108 TaxID=1736256 RepID=UPI0007013CEE|nr:hypothetical protein [Methylobacterium sp. Leaf108]KQP58148.1 hypothetical protein ASF39_18260 [Methylobacterium sp. Leaf108]
MLTRSLLILILGSIAAPALALQPRDTLRDWSAATGADRDRLLQQLEKSSEVGVPREDVLSCLNDAASMTAHADLAIHDVFRACTKQTLKDSI